MKRSFMLLVLTFALFVGIFATPALAYNANYRVHNYNNIIYPMGTYGRYTIINTQNYDRVGILLRLDNWYVNMRNGNPDEYPLEPDLNDSNQGMSRPEDTPHNIGAPSSDESTNSNNKPAPPPEDKPIPEKEKEPTPVPNPIPEQEKKPEPIPEPRPEEKPTPDKPQVPTPPQGIGDQQASMLAKVNEERVNAGLKALQWDGDLASVAQVKAQDMSDNNYFDHNSPTYGSPFEMMKKFGISYKAAAENLAGSSNVDRAHIGLMNSDGHRRNILNSNFTHMGIGIANSQRYGYVYVQMFVGR